MADQDSDEIASQKRLMVATIGIAFQYLREAELNDVMMRNCIELLKHSAAGLEELMDRVGGENESK